MTTLTQAEPTRADEILEAVTSLAPAVRDRAAEIETARHVPADLLDDLVSAGCFRLLVPHDLGGVGADLEMAIRVYETLSRADASVGWIAMIGSGAWLDLAGLPRETLEAIYGEGSDVMIAGAFNPTGVAEAVDGGYRVNGRWAFASGCTHSDWIFGNCIEEIDGEGHLRTVLFAADEVQIEDTWTVLGLRGTASHHFRADAVVVPRERTFATFEDPPVLDEPIVRIPLPALLALGIASVAIGTAQGALDEITQAAASRTPLLAPSALAANPRFQNDLACADTELQAASALVRGVAVGAWDTVCSGDELSMEQRARIRAAAVWAVERAAHAVSVAYRAGGGGAVYADSDLQRRFRDINAITQHFLVRPDTMLTAGAILAGQEVDVAVF
jgi:indole-3-acetate monooxygenase